MAEPANPLSHEAESWLYLNDPTAWGYLKAIQHEHSLKQIGRIKAILTHEVRASISEAYRRSNRK